MPLLEGKGVTKYFGEQAAVSNVDFNVQQGETLDEVYRLFPILRARQGQLARTLSGGKKQMLAIGRGLMSRPRMCIIDEPSSGLAPLLVTEIFPIIQGLHDQGIAIFLIEQNVQQTLNIASRAYVLENGRVILEGETKKLLQKELMRKAYMGL